MLSESSVELRARFLEEFVAEILAAIKERNERKAKSLLEFEKRRQKVDIEKLKVKYIEQKKEIDEGIIKEEFVPSIVHEQKLVQKSAQIVQQAKPAPMLIPLQPIDMEFGRIAFLVNDPRVSSIECPGEGKEIIIKKDGQVSKTDIKLNREEIDKIISDFSEKARIPLIEGLLRARLANLQISAIVSKAASSRFILTKIYVPQIRTMEKRVPAGPVAVRPANMFPRMPMRSGMPPARFGLQGLNITTRANLSPGQIIPTKQIISPPFPKIPQPPKAQTPQQQSPPQLVQQPALSAPQPAPSAQQQVTQPANQQTQIQNKIITPINRPFVQNQTKSEPQKK